MPEDRPRSRTFGPVVAAGLALAGLTALASTRAWFAPASDSAAVVVATADDAQAPLATALSLVVLATWGVVLVSRGRVRRAVTVLGVVASLGALVVTAWAWWTVPAQLRTDLARLGESDLGADPTAWYALALVAAVLEIATLAAAWRWLPTWPEMGRRYDAPTAAATPEDPSSLDLWKAIDEGRDPTEGAS
jgi:hypothetical protein